MMRAKVATLGLCLLLGTSPAAAQPADDDKIPRPGDGGGAAPVPAGDDKPWEKGVSPENRQAAKELTREGNQLVKEYQWASAAERYRNALKLWKHPAIHYNLAMALLNLNEPLELYRALTEAVKYGADGLGSQSKLDKAEMERKKAEGLLARVKISSKQQGVVVLLDGNQIFVGPGSYEDWVLAGSHTVRGTKPGLLARTETRKLLPGEVFDFSFQLLTSEEAIAYRRRWPVWQPWVVFGGGLAVTGAAGLLHLSARSSFRDFDQGIVDCGGCNPEDVPGLADKKSTGETRQLMAMIGYGVGGAALITGSVLLYLNRAESYRIDEEGPASAGLAPWIGPDGAGVTASYRF